MMSVDGYIKGNYGQYGRHWKHDEGIMNRTNGDKLRRSLTTISTFEAANYVGKPETNNNDKE